MNEAPRPTQPPPPTTPIMFEAIVKKQAVAATYNRGEVILAPHVLYTRHDELHIDAVTLERDGKPPREEKLGTFKLAGLGPIRITPRRFTVSEQFDVSDARYAGVVLMAVEPD